LQAECKKGGLPWEIAKGFDYSAPVSKFLPLTNFADIHNLNFHLDINGERVQTGNTSEMIFSFEHIISYVSQFITLKTGDLIYTGTPAGVGPVKKGDVLEGFLNQVQMLNTTIK